MSGPSGLSSDAAADRVTTLGVSAATKRGQKSALNRFDLFLESTDRQPLDQWPQNAETESFFCDAMIFDVYAAFLLEQSVTKTSVHDKSKYQQGLEVGTILQYLSGAKEEIKRMWPQNPLWVNEDWYNKIRESTEKCWKRRAIQNRDNFHSRQPPIGNKQLMDMTSELLKQCGGVRSVDPTPLNRRAALVVSSYFAARTAESVNFSWEHVEWNSPFGLFIVQWPETKTLSLKPYPVIPHMFDFEIDVIHALGSSYAVGAGCSTLSPDYDPDWCSVLPYSTPKYVGDSISLLAATYDESGNHVSGVASIDRSMSAKSLRTGKVCEILNEPRVSELHGKLWGGWEADSSMSEYVKQTMHSGLIAAKAGFNYADPWQKCFMPDTSVFITLENKKDWETYMEGLFGRATHVNLLRGPHHLNTRIFAHAMLASLLMWLDAFITKYGCNHLLVRAMCEAGLGRFVQGRPIDLAFLKECGAAIKSKFDSDNSVAMCPISGGGDYAPAISAMSRELGNLRSNQAKIGADVAELKTLLQGLW